MSASIYYRKVSKSNKNLDVSMPSSFVTSMTNAFGNYPWRVSPTSLAILKGMAAVSPDKLSNPYEQLIQIIGDNNEVEIWPEYNEVEIWPEY
jgi:hypothetical protein